MALSNEAWAVGIVIPKPSLVSLSHTGRLRSRQLQPLQFSPILRYTDEGGTKNLDVTRHDPMPKIRYSTRRARPLIGRSKATRLERFRRDKGKLRNVARTGPIFRRRSETRPG